MKHASFNRNAPRFEIADIWPGTAVAANTVLFNDYGKAVSFAMGLKRLYPDVRVFMRDKITRRVIPIGR